MAPAVRTSEAGGWTSGRAARMATAAKVAKVAKDAGKLAAGVAIALPVAGLTLATIADAHGVVDPTAPDVGIIFTSWRFEATVAVPLALAAIGWLVLVDRIDRRHPASPVPVRRTVAFLSGLAVIAFALMSGIERYDTTLFSVHMVQHLLLMLVAPPLLLFGAPVTQLLRAASSRVRRRWLIPFLHSAPVAFLTHPVTAWVLFTAVLWAAHFSPLFDLALENPGVHEVEHVLFVGAALLFWWPVVAADPAPRRLSYPARALYLLLQMPPSSFLAMSILFTNAPLYNHYATLRSPYGISALDDQQAAASLMWIAGDMVFIAAILLLVAAWIRQDERGTLAAERRLDAERLALAERADRLAARRGGPIGQ
jgi:cytochrome c oxidase assembly factor CtaG